MCDNAEAGLPLFTSGLSRILTHQLSVEKNVDTTWREAVSEKVKSAVAEATLVALAIVVTSYVADDAVFQARVKDGTTFYNLLVELRNTKGFDEPIGSAIFDDDTTEVCRGVS